MQQCWATVTVYPSCGMMGKTTASRKRKTPPFRVQICFTRSLWWEGPRLIDSPMSRKQHRHLAICLLPTAKILVYSCLLKQVFYGPSTCFEGDRNKAAASEDERKQKKNTSVLKKKPRRGTVPFVTSQADLETRRKHYEKRTGPSHFSVVQLRNIGAYYC